MLQSNKLNESFTGGTWIDLSYRATNESYTSNIYFMGYYHNSLKIM